MASPILTLTNREILKLVEGLKALDGVSNETGKIERYEFDENLGWNTSKDRHLVERAAEVHQKARASLAARLGVIENMKVTDANAASIAKYMDEEQKLLDKTQDIPGLLKLSRKELHKAGVRIPGIYVALMAILEDK